MIILGFDPGGVTGVAAVRCSPMGVVSATVDSEHSVDSAIEWAIGQCEDEAPAAAGIDTYLSWATGRSGWRAMDNLLRQKYPKFKASVFSSNSAYGAMAVQGMAIAVRLRERWPKIHLNETHPKVLYHAQTGGLYLRDDIEPMVVWLKSQFAAPSPTRVDNEHQWDALISAWATEEGLSGRWSSDLVSGVPNLIFPAGQVTYFWPDPLT